MTAREDICFRLLKRAEIRRQIITRKSVQEGKPDRIADLLEEAAAEITYLRDKRPSKANKVVTSAVLITASLIIAHYIAELAIRVI